RSIPNFSSYFLTPCIYFYTDVLLLECACTLLCIVIRIVGNRNNLNLFRGQPYREIARKMFDQYTGEALHRSEWCAVNDYWSVPIVIGAHISQIKTFRHYIIYLYGASLPFTTNSITYNKVYFGTVEAGFPTSNGVVQVFLIGYFPDFPFSTFPVFSFATVFLFIIIAKREADIHWHIKGAKNEIRKVYDILNFIL